MKVYIALVWDADLVNISAPEETYEAAKEAQAALVAARPPGEYGTIIVGPLEADKIDFVFN